MIAFLKDGLDPTSKNSDSGHYDLGGAGGAGGAGVSRGAGAVVPVPGTNIIL